MSDPQDQAEMLDEDVVDTSDDRTGEAYGDGLPDFPPEEPLGVEATGTTPVEEDAGESFAEREAHRRPETVAGSAPTEERRPATAAEEAAMHIEQTPNLDEPPANPGDDLGGR